MGASPGAGRVVILDVDGVVSPVGGSSTAWEDDLVAGHVFGPVRVSPTLCARLDELSHVANVSCVWLTSWSADMRAGLLPFPGRAWPVVRDLEGAELPEQGWWKLAALERWLDSHPEVTHVAWCDDHLLGDRPAAARRSLHIRGIETLFLAPRTEVGLTPQDMDLLDAWAHT